MFSFLINHATSLLFISYVSLCTRALADVLYTAKKRLSIPFRNSFSSVLWFIHNKLEVAKRKKNNNKKSLRIFFTTFMLKNFYFRSWSTIRRSWSVCKDEKYIFTRLCFHFIHQQYIYWYERFFFKCKEVLSRRQRLMEYLKRHCSENRWVVGCSIYTNKRDESQMIENFFTQRKSIATPPPQFNASIESRCTTKHHTHDESLVAMEKKDEEWVKTMF